MANIIGTIKSIENKKVKVDIPVEGCSQCPQKGHCRIMDHNAYNTVFIDDANINELHVGDSVELSVHYKQIIFLSLFLYVFPVVMLLLFAIIGNLFYKNEIIIALFGIIGAFVSFIIIKLFDMKRGKDFKHKIKRVVK